jgi:hypothetical protein
MIADVKTILNSLLKEFFDKLLFHKQISYLYVNNKLSITHKLINHPIYSRDGRVLAKLFNMQTFLITLH